MDLKKSMDKMDAKIDNFVRMEAAATAEQRNLLENINNKIGNLTIGSVQPNTGGSPDRDETIERKLASLCNENDKMRRDFIALQASLLEKITEQKLSYEKQLLDIKAETEQALACLRNENKTLTERMAEQRLFQENQLADTRAKMEQDLACLRNENETVRHNFAEMAEMTLSYEDCLKNETGAVRREMAELKLSHENQLAEDRLKAEKMRADLEGLQATISSNITEMELLKKQVLQNRAETKEAVTTSEVKKIVEKNQAYDK